MSDNIYIHIILLILAIAFSAAAVMRVRVIKAAIMLATVSIIVTLILFLLKTPLAAVFELSVCAGLITVIFISVISLTNSLTQEERKAEAKVMFKAFVFLPLLLAVCAASFYFLTKGLNFAPIPEVAAQEIAARSALWHFRGFDLIGQIIIILSGIFGIVVLFKNNKEDK